MALIKLNLNPSPAILRQFAAALLSVTLLWGFCKQELWVGQPAVKLVLLWAVALGMLGLFLPRTLKYLFIALSLVTFPVGYVVSFLMLGAVYFGVLTPVAILMRLAGRDLLRLRKEAAGSYWLKRETPSKLDYYLHQ